MLFFGIGQFQSFSIMFPYSCQSLREQYCFRSNTGLSWNPRLEKYRQEKEEEKTTGEAPRTSRSWMFLSDFSIKLKQEQWLDLAVHVRVWQSPGEQDLPEWPDTGMEVGGCCSGGVTPLPYLWAPEGELESFWQSTVWGLTCWEADTAILELEEEGRAACPYCGFHLVC